MSLSQAITEAVLPDTRPRISECNIKHLVKGYLSYGIRALETLDSGNLQKFDALGGDTACQKRAIIICQLYEERQNLCLCLCENFKQNLLSLEPKPARIDVFLSGKKEKETYIQQLIENIDLKPAAKVAILAFMLTETRGVQDKSKTEASHLTDFPKHLQEDVCFQLKHALSKDSVAIIQTIGKELITKKKISKAELSLIERKNVRLHGRVTRTPLFYNMRIILEKIKELGIPILINTPQGNHLFIANEGALKKVDLSAIDPTRAVFLIKGEITAGSELKIDRIEEEIMVPCAHHPQYPKEEGMTPKIDSFQGAIRSELLEKTLELSLLEKISIPEATTSFINKKIQKERGPYQAAWGNGQKPEEVICAYALLIKHQQLPLNLDIKHIYPSTLQEA